MENGASFKSTNLLFFRKAEASVPMGFTTLKVRGRSVFGKPSYEVLLEEHAGAQTLKARGGFIDIVGALRKNQKAWHAIADAVGRVAEAISDESRNLRKMFSHDELVCIAGLEMGGEMDELARRTRLEPARVSAAVGALQRKRMAGVNEFSFVSLTGIGEGVRRFLSEDPVFSRIEAMLARAPEKAPAGK